jgi:tetratricopeptide (TPR) repeat protein
MFQLSWVRAWRQSVQSDVLLFIWMTLIVIVRHACSAYFPPCHIEVAVYRHKSGTNPNTERPDCYLFHCLQHILLDHSFIKQFIMAQAISAMNNRAARALAQGQEMEAIEFLRETLGLLSDLCRQEIKEDCDDLDRKRIRDPDAYYGTSILTVLNSFGISEWAPEFAFVYNYGFALLTPDANLGITHSSERDVSITTSTAIYNMALAYHRLVLLAPRNPLRNILISKAVTFYEQAIELSLMAASKRGVDAADYGTVLRIAVASYNNLGQMNFDFRSDYETAIRCFAAVSSLLNRIGSEVPTCDGETMFQVEGWRGILSNLVLLEMLHINVAPAA